MDKMSRSRRPLALRRAFLPVLMVLLAGACEPGPRHDAAASARDEASRATAAAPTSAEPASRYPADDPGDAIALPDDVVRALSTDERVLDCAQGVRGGQSRFAADWVAARRVDLDDDGDGDWILNGRHACLREGAAADWWLYADEGTARRRLLVVDSADALEVSEGRTQGLRDLRIVRGGQVRRATYDGVGYAMP